VQQVAHFEITLQQKSKWRFIFWPESFPWELAKTGVVIDRLSSQVTMRGAEQVLA
jgi:hypothetical protein